MTCQASTILALRRSPIKRSPDYALLSDGHTAKHAPRGRCGWLTDLISISGPVFTWCSQGASLTELVPALRAITLTVRFNRAFRTKPSLGTNPLAVLIVASRTAVSACSTKSGHFKPPIAEAVRESTAISIHLVESKLTYCPPVHHSQPWSEPSAVGRPYFPAGHEISSVS